MFWLWLCPLEAVAIALQQQPSASLFQIAQPFF